MDDLKEQICKLLFKKSDYKKKGISSDHLLHEREFDNVAEEVLTLLEQSQERFSVDAVDMWTFLDEELPQLDEIVWLNDGKMTWIGGRTMIDNKHWVFGNTHGSIWHNGKKWDGDLELDDDYQPKFWKPLPEPPKAN